MEDSFGSKAEADDLVLYAPSTRWGELLIGKILEFKDDERLKVEIQQLKRSRKWNSVSGRHDGEEIIPRPSYWKPNGSNWLLVKSIPGMVDFFTR